jgi:hypothetical protein
MQVAALQLVPVVRVQPPAVEPLQTLTLLQIEEQAEEAPLPLTEEQADLVE